jgi:hypothetical protein
MGKGRTRSYRSWDSSDSDSDEGMYAGRYEESEEQERYAPVRRRRRRKRSMWPALLIGCGLGIFLAVLAAGAVVFFAIRSAQGLGSGGGIGGIGGIGNAPTMRQDATQTVPLTAFSTLAQLQICDSIGDVTITADPNASAITVASEKIVHAANTSAAAQEFGRIGVNVQPIALSAGASSSPLACASSTGATPPMQAGSPGGANVLAVVVSLPQSEGVFRGTTDAVNITLTVPQSALSNAGTPFLLNVNAPLGNIKVTGISGNLQLKGSSGNITVSQAVLAIGTHIETGQGNVTFSGALALPDGTPAQGSTPARYLLQSEQGNIDVTLSANTSVTLDANTNVGTISSSDFPLSIQNSSGGGMSYDGPLNTASAVAPTSVLILDVSTGNVTLHKATV